MSRDSQSIKDSTEVHEEQEFSGIRKLLWPIHNHELKKFIPLSLLMFCILFNYTLLRDTKDSLVVNASGAGAISFLKLYCVTPAAILFVIFYAKLINIFDRETVFYVVISPFLIFFGVFAFILYPNLNVLHPSEEWVRSMYASFPSLSGFIDIIAYWCYSLFYIMSEIWGSAMLALLFWQFANQIVKMKEAKRFYGLFVVIGNTSLIFSGQALRFCSTGIRKFYPGNESYAWQVSLYLLMGTVVIMGLFAMAIYRWINKEVLTDPNCYDSSQQRAASKKKKPGLKESFKIICSSPELGLIATLIIAYGISINLVEVQWKNQVKLYFSGDVAAYNSFMGNYSSWTGVVTILFALFVGSNILRVLSWFKSALVTPAFILISGALFFCFILSSRIMGIQFLISELLIKLSTNPIVAASFLGAGIVLTSKTIKYCLFDPTKEMAYIPLDDELRTKGKAAVDVIGGRAGKAGGAFVQSTLMILFATKDVLVIAPIGFVIFGFICLIWLMAVKMLSVRITKAESIAEAEKEKSVVRTEAEDFSNKNGKAQYA